MTKETLIKRLESLIRAQKREIKRLKEMIGESFKERNKSYERKRIAHYIKLIKIRKREVDSLQTKRKDLRSGERNAMQILREIRIETQY